MKIQYCLLENQSDYLERITIQKNVEVNNLEKLSIWSMIALTHDLGYPLEKAQGIIEKTKSMMKTFVSNPTISMDLSFNGIQTNMNDYVVRFISSKMRECKPLCVQNRENQEEKHYVARLQPKYYYKFEKSLEGYKHGILSATIIYKLLIYFLESDFSINEDYEFNEEEAILILSVKKGVLTIRKSGLARRMRQISKNIVKAIHILRQLY